MGLTSLRSSSENASRRSVKFEKKKLFYENVRKAAISLSATKTINKKKRIRSRQKKLKAYDLSSLSATLQDEVQVNPSLINHEAPSYAKPNVNCKSRKKILEKEGKQLHAVLSHPAFKLDPAAAIRQHLESTQPLTVAPAKEKKKEKEKKKKKRLVSSSGAKSMEM